MTKPPQSYTLEHYFGRLHLRGGFSVIHLRQYGHR
jgi:hypothetical protein